MGNEITNTQEITNVSTDLIYHVSLTECKEQLGLVFSQNYDDNYLNRLIISAHQEVGNIIQKDVTRTSNVSQLWDFSGTTIRINKGNYNSIVSIIDTDSSTRITTSSTLRVYPEYFQIDLTDNATSDPLTVTFITGYDDGQCPEIIKQAILMKINAYYDMERTGYTTGGYKDNKTAERLLANYMSVGTLF